MSQEESLKTVQRFLTMPQSQLLPMMIRYARESHKPLRAVHAEIAVIRACNMPKAPEWAVRTMGYMVRQNKTLPEIKRAHAGAVKERRKGEAISAIVIGQYKKK